MIHLLVSRVALKFNDQRLKVPWEEWVLHRVMLYNQLTRPSISNQTNQEFILLSLVDESVFMSDPYFENYMLRNEVVIPVPNEFTYPFEGIVNSIKDYVDKINYADEVIVSRIDSDDFLHQDYVENVQKHLTQPNTYVDIKNSYTYNLETGKVYSSSKYRDIVSPFVSVRESIRDFKCLPYLMYHHDIDKQISGTKHNDIAVLQTIHSHNLVNKQSGVDISSVFPFNEYGGYWQ